MTIRILIADDDAGDRRLLRRSIRASGLLCEIDEAFDLAEAKAACASNRYDCALIDYRMPGGDGLEGIVAIREMHPHLPIIMATGQGDEMIASEAIKLGAADYVPKSQISPGYIAHVIKNALRKAELERIVADQREELERFAHVLAHDLKTPIHQIQYLARFIERDIDNGDFDKLAENGLKLIATAQRMDDLINTLQQYAMSGKPVNMDTIGLDAALDGCLSNLAMDIASGGARIMRLPLPSVYGNLPLLTQLFQNLIGNSLKHCAVGRPEISVSAEVLEGHVAVRVADNGAGVPEEYREAIFQPFRRLQRERQAEGTGLGLAICRKIAERHGGRIWCEGAPGGGSHFCFTIAHQASDGAPHHLS